MKKFTIKNYSIVLGILLLFLIWYISSHVINNSLVIPKISEVFSSLINLLKSKITYVAILNTISRLLLTVLISFILAMLLAIISSNVSFIKNLLMPLITLLRVVPVASIIIILLMAFGNVKSPYIITSFVIFPIMYEQFLSSFNLIDKGITDEVRLQTNINYMVVRYIYIPLVSPRILSSIISVLGLGLKVMVMAEFIAQPYNTIGYLMLQEKNFLEIGNVFAWTIILIIFIVIFEEIIHIIEKKLSIS